MEHARSGDRSAARSSLARGLALLQAGQLGVPSADPSAEETNGCRAPGSSYLALGQSVVVGNKQSGGFPVHGRCIQQMGQSGHTLAGVPVLLHLFGGLGRDQNPGALEPRHHP